MSLVVGAGSPEPLGVLPDLQGVNVAIFSANATAIEFCLFDASDREVYRIRLPERTGEVFHGHIAGVRPGDRYGLRAHGPFQPAAGHRFNAAKLLVDPHARLLDRPLRLHAAMFGYPEGADDRAFDPTDSAPFMPKAVVTDPSGPREAHRPLTPWRETVLYELHVRGFTQLHPQVAQMDRGTFAGLRSPAAIEHLVQLGITSVEIMPCAAWIEERHLAKLGLVNYWGYNPVGFMAPEPHLAPGGWDEIRHTIAALASAGIETLVDVVLNHSGEGDELGPTLSLRGLDNASYYRLRPDDPARYIDDAGCGNTLALDRPPVVRLAMDALRTWVREAGVHGFRFDLAATMGRRGAGAFDADAPLLAAIAQDPELAPLKLIAEPWDIGPGGYQLGRFPSGWGEWNDKFRDDVRRFWRGDPHRLGPLATRLAGSADVLAEHRPLSRSVNFVTAHDGFALADLVAHEAKRNAANGEDNRDGTDANFSWNNGWEGPSDEPAIRAARAQDQRALIATLVFARGTPMLGMGAELGHSQRGNNNCYAQDNELAWLRWDQADPELLAFTRRAVALRRASTLLNSDARLRGEAGRGGLPDVVWLTPAGIPLEPSDWEVPEAASLLMLLSGGEERAGVLLHRGQEPIAFALPEPRRGHRWEVLLDSAAGRSGEVSSGAIEVPARCVLLLGERRYARMSGISSATLGRLSKAAGIEAEWWSVDGTRQAVSEDTQRHLLAAMRLAAGSESEADESLQRLSEAGELRPVPHAALSAPTGGEITLPFEPGLHRPLWLTIENESGATARILSSGAEMQAARARDGRHFEQRVIPLPALAQGRYRIRRDDFPDLEGSLSVAPERAYLPPGLLSGPGRWGLAAQLYALCREADQGIGDFTTLAQLASQAASEGADLVGINPLHALFPDQRERASPYQPSDRRFLDPIYLDLAALLDLPGGDALIPALAHSGLASLRASANVDYAAVWSLKQIALRGFFAKFEASSAGTRALLELEAFTLAGASPLHHFGVFSALSASQPGISWTSWPAALHDPEGQEVRRFVAAHGPEVRYQVFLQWLCERQLASAAAAARRVGMDIGLYRDLAVGSAPDGAEAWAQQTLLATGVSIGAPPDPLGPHGQVWGLPPPDPHAMEADAFSSFDRLLASNMAHAGALRIDHAMGLSRLFWVPEKASAADGAYVRYPHKQLIGRVALASQTARTMVIGEDLGTVPEGFRQVLADAGMLGYRVALLERGSDGFKPTSSYPKLSLACLTSHDLPTLPGWWKGADIAEQASLGLMDAAAAMKAHAARGSDKLGLARLAGVAGGAADTQELPPEVHAGLHATLTAAPSMLVLAQVDDLAGEVTSVNLPGTDAERPNWRRKNRVALPDLFAASNAAFLGLIAALRPTRREVKNARAANRR